MKWINSRFLFNANQEISAACSASGAHIYSKIECFSIPQPKQSRRRSDSKEGISEVEQIKCPTPGESNFNAMKDAIANSFPDYEFSGLQPEHFQRIATPEQARSTIAWNLSSHLPDNGSLAHNIWRAMENEISPAFCDIYNYEPTCADVFTENGAVWAKVLLFVNEKARKVVLFHIREGAQDFESEDDSEFFDYDDDVVDHRFGFGVF